MSPVTPGLLSTGWCICTRDNAEPYSHRTPYAFIRTPSRLKTTTIHPWHINKSDPVSHHLVTATSRTGYRIFGSSQIPIIQDPKILVRDPDLIQKLWIQPDSDLTGSSEIEYLGLPLQNHTANLLDWWNEHAIPFPYFAILARKFLATPASSVYLERLFPE